MIAMNYDIKMNFKNKHFLIGQKGYIFLIHYLINKLFHPIFKLFLSKILNLIKITLYHYFHKNSFKIFDFVILFIFAMNFRDLNKNSYHHILNKSISYLKIDFDFFVLLKCLIFLINDFDFIY